MKYVVSVIIEAHFYMISIVLASFIVEKVTRLKLLIDIFRWKKSEYLAHGAANVYSLLYFLISLGILLYNVHVRKNFPEDYALWKWFAIIIPLTVIIRSLCFKYQAKDPNKEGFHID